MQMHLKALMVDTSTGFYRTNRYKLGDFFGPVDLGLHLAGKHNSLNMGVGLLAGSIFPGSNRLVFTGFSPCWGGFYISSMGGAGLVFDNLGINMLSLVGRAATPSVLCLNRIHGEEIQVELHPINATDIWQKEPGGVYAIMAHCLKHFAGQYETGPRILAVGPASAVTDIGAIVSAPVNQDQLSHVDTWAGRGGLGSKLFQQHDIAAIIYGGTFIDEDFRDRKVADQWFMDKYQKKLAAKDLEATTKYRFDPKFKTGGTLGVNYATLAGTMLSFNYGSMYMPEETRLDIHNRFILQHYLKQFNEETIDKKQQKNCGEPCAAVCKKMNGAFKKDYEPYHAMGPQCGIFDQRAAEALTHHADMYGFDAISVGGVLSWLMDCLVHKDLTPENLGVTQIPVFDVNGFDVIATSQHNAQIGIGLLDAIIEQKGLLNLSQGARRFARHLARDKGAQILDRFVYTAFARKGWMVPNQYWTPGVLSPMAIMGKYYMYYGQDFVPPRKLGRMNGERFCTELMIDNLGFCRFHRNWAEDMIPEIMGSLFDLRQPYLDNVRMTASRINSRNASAFWESERSIDLIHTFLKRKHRVEGQQAPELLQWLDHFEKDKHEAALSFWYEIHKGIQESLKEF